MSTKTKEPVKKKGAAKPKAEGKEKQAVAGNNKVPLAKKAGGPMPTIDELKASKLDKIRVLTRERMELEEKKEKFTKNINGQIADKQGQIAQLLSEDDSQFELFKPATVEGDKAEKEKEPEKAKAEGKEKDDGKSDAPKQAPVVPVGGAAAEQAAQGAATQNGDGAEKK